MKNSIFATFISIGASIVALLGMVTCCGLPLIAGALAVIGIGSSQLSFFAEYQDIFIGLAICALLIGFYQAYFSKKTQCCNTASATADCECSATPVTDCCDSKTKAAAMFGFQQFQKCFLWVGAVLLVAVIAFAGNSKQNTPQSNQECGPSCGTDCTPADANNNSEESLPKIIIPQELKDVTNSCCP
ncbi:MAG: hypothetical protein ACRC2T_17025 [Thermoguttaceae bacterium]